MKKTLAILLALLLLLSLTACGSKNETTTNTPGEGSTGSAPSGTLPTKAPAQEATPAPSPAPTPEPPEMVSITIPAGYVDSDMSEAEIIAQAQEEGMEAVINEDGSVTYTMTKEQHAQIMSDMTEEFEELLKELTVGEEAVASFTEIRHDADYSDFDIMLDAEKYDEWDAFYALSLVMYAGAYRIYAGDGEPEVAVRLTDAASGEVYDTVTYQDFMEFVESMSDLDFGDDWDIEGTVSYDFPIPELEEQTVLDAEGIKVTVTGISADSFWGPTLDVHVINGSDKEIMILADAFSVNDFCSSGALYCTVPAGEEADDCLFLPVSDMELVGTEYIGKIELRLSVLDPGTYETVCEGELVELRTSDYGEAWQAGPLGEIIFEVGGVTIRYMGAIDDPEWENYSMNFCVENSTESTVYVDCDEMKINGVSVNPWFYAEMLPGRKFISGVGFYTSEFEELEIGWPETVEMTFSAYDSDTYDTIFEGETVTFPAGQG